MLKLNLIADTAVGWLLIVRQMIDTIPPDMPLGPAVITLFLDESPLPKRVSCLLCLFVRTTAPRKSAFRWEKEGIQLRSSAKLT